MKELIAILSLSALFMLWPRRARGAAAGDLSPTENPLSWQLLPLISKVPGDRAAFGAKVIDVARKLNARPADLMAIMDFESAGTFRADKWGGSGGAYVGLIQFGEAAAEDLGTDQATLANLSNVAQLDYVYQYFRRWQRILGLDRIDGIADLYLLVLYPAAVRQRDPEARLPIPGRQAAMLYNDRGEITKNSIRAMFARRYPQIQFA